MIVWLDHKIFGNGYGLRSPYFDDRFYWLSGEFYTWSGGLGAQLQSFQWRHPRAGEERELCGHKFRPFYSERRFMWLWRSHVFGFPLPVARVRVSWCTHLPDKLDEANETLRQLRRELNDM